MDDILFSGKKKILLVDDNATVLRSIKEILSANYDVSVAKSGKKALDQMRLDRPDLLLLDYEMPEMDGRSLRKCGRIWICLPSR